MSHTSKDHSHGHTNKCVKYITKLSQSNSKEEELDLIRNDLRRMKQELAGKTSSVISMAIENSKLDAYYDDDDDDDDHSGAGDTVGDITSKSGKKYSYKELTMKERVVRVLQAEMCGLTAAFAHIQCVHLLPCSYVPFKRTGYIGLAVCVPPDSELYYLVIAQMQKDFKSDNYLEVSAALTAAERGLRLELATVVEEEVKGLLHHKRAMVRRKAVEALHAFFKLQWLEAERMETEKGDSVREELIAQYLPLLRQALCDSNPSVMAAAVRFFHYYIFFACNRSGGGGGLATREEEEETASLFSQMVHDQVDLIPSFLTILQQVIQKRLPEPYEYHHTPVPWLQMHLIQLITCLTGQKLLFAKHSSSPSSSDHHLGQKEISASDCVLLNNVLHTLSDAMQRADNGMFIGFAVICEVIRAVANLLPAYDFSCLDDDEEGEGGALLSSSSPTTGNFHGGGNSNTVNTTIFSLATQAIHKFLSSKSANVRYSGIEALCCLTKHNPNFALPHQDQVMLLLENKEEEESLLRVTIHLLLTMASSRNVDTIIQQVLQFVKRGNTTRRVGSAVSHSSPMSPFLKFQATRGVIGLAVRYCSTPTAYIRTMNKVMLASPEYLYNKDIQLLLKVISESYSGTSFYPPAGEEKEGEMERETMWFRMHLVELYYVLLGGDIRVFLRGNTTSTTNNSTTTNNNNNNEENSTPTSIGGSPTTLAVNPLLKHFLFYKGILLHHQTGSDTMSQSSGNFNNNSFTSILSNKDGMTRAVAAGGVTAGNLLTLHQLMNSSTTTVNPFRRHRPIPECMYKTAAWVMGEFGSLAHRVYPSPQRPAASSSINLNTLLQVLLEALEKCEENDTKGYIVSALMKLTSHAMQVKPEGASTTSLGVIEEETEELLRAAIVKYSHSRCIRLHQRCSEFLALLRQFPNLFKKCFPLSEDARETRMDVDESLSFLDPVVEQARKRGAVGYQTEKKRKGSYGGGAKRQASSEREGGRLSALKTDAYAAPSLYPNNANGLMIQTNLFGSDPSSLVGSPWGPAQQGKHRDGTLGEGETKDDGFYRPQTMIHNNNNSNLFPEDILKISTDVKRWGFNNQQAHHPPQQNKNPLSHHHQPTDTQQGRNANESSSSMATGNGPTTFANKEPEPSSYPPQSKTEGSAMGQTVKNKKLMNDIFGGKPLKRNYPTPSSSTTERPPASFSSPDHPTKDKEKPVEKSSQSQSAPLDSLFGPAADSEAYHVTTRSTPARDPLEGLFSDPATTNEGAVDVFAPTLSVARARTVLQQRGCLA